MTPATDVVIIGAGAAGLMCALTAAERGRHVLLIEHANKPGKKILMSGGGRCNFTNMYAEPANFASQNPHFCKSALARYTPWDFIAMVDAHGVPYHEKKLGQLFCDNRSKDILEMLLGECRRAGVELHVSTAVQRIEKSAAGYALAAKQLLPALCNTLGEFITGMPVEQALESRTADTSSLLGRMGGVSRLWRRSTGVPAPIVVPAG